MKEIAKKQIVLGWLLVLIFLLVAFWSRNSLQNEDATISEPPAALPPSPKKADLGSAAMGELSDQGTRTSTTAIDLLKANLDSALEARMEQAMQIPDPELRRTALVKECFDLAERDPASAVAAADRYLGHEGPAIDLQNLTQRWAMADLNAAYIWVGARPRSIERDGLVTRVAFVWSQSAPANAAKWLLNETQSGPGQEEAVISLVHQWGIRDLAGVSAWVSQFPAGDFRERAIRELQGVADLQDAP